MPGYARAPMEAASHVDGSLNWRVSNAKSVDPWTTRATKLHDSPCYHSGLLSVCGEITRYVTGGECSGARTGIGCVCLQPKPVCLLQFGDARPRRMTFAWEVALAALSAQKELSHLLPVLRKGGAAMSSLLPDLPSAALPVQLQSTSRLSKTSH
mmetsp:Transcript_110675/g.219988  ORF Transcript_110675/g.219988 Transcript_110675/m.219988 type:complete len:154 (+) Transcript_110675:106-567(+)